MPCSEGTCCGIHLLVPLVKCGILLVARLTDPFQGWAPSHCFSDLSGTYVPPPATLWQWHAGTFRGVSPVSAGFLDPTWDIRLGIDQTLPSVAPPKRRFLLALPYGGPPRFF